MDHKDPIDELLRETFRVIRGCEERAFENIAIPDADKVLAKMYIRINQVEAKRSARKQTRVKIFCNVTAITAALMLVISLNTIWGDHPKVQALRSQVVRIFYEATEDLMIIRSSDMDFQNFPPGAPPPPPPDAPEIRFSDAAHVLEEMPMVEVIIPEKNQAVYLTLEEAGQAVDFPLLIPSYIPETFILKKVEITHYGPEHIIVEQHYQTSDDKVFRISQNSGYVNFASTTATTQKVIEMEVWGQPAVMITNHTDFSSVFWHRDDFRYDLMGMISYEEMVKVIDSLRSPS